MKRALRTKGLLYFAFALAAGVAMPASAAPTKLYASPTGVASGTCTEAAPCSLEGAKTRARAFINSGQLDDVIVYLRGGWYNLTATFALDINDSGRNGFNVIYQNYPNEQPILSGGMQVTNWTLVDREKGIYRAPVGPRGFRQIYVNGQRAIRARTPNMTNPETRGPYYTAVSAVPLTVKASQVGNWYNLNQVEAVWSAHWMHKRARIASFTMSGQNAIINFQNPEQSDSVLNSTAQTTTNMYFENAYEFLDAEGEWYLDKTQQMLYYKPRNGEDLNGTTQVVVPQLDQLMKIMAANYAAPVHNIQVKGLRFMYSNWLAPDVYGYLISQAALALHTNGYASVPGAVWINNASNIVLDGNYFQFTGAHALLMNGPLTDNIIQNNTFTDLSAGGIYEFAETYGGAKGSRTQIRHNIVEKFGRYYTDAVGIFAGRSNNIMIEYNQVSQAPYSAISVGWSWDNSDQGAINNTVRYNKIHSVMQLHDDGGGIYTLGRMDNMMIDHNFISNINASPYNGGYPIAGIYLDNGSQYKTVANNVLDETVTAFYAKNAPNLDNVFKDNYYKGPLGTVVNTNTLSNNTQFASGASWSSDVGAIVQAAGGN